MHGKDSKGHRRFDGGSFLFVGCIPGFALGLERVAFWAAWRPCRKPADKTEKEAMKACYRHWDMVPFDQLDDFTQGLDRVVIAAMSVCGLIG